MTYDNATLEKYAALRLSDGYEQHGWQDWSDTAILMAGELRQARRDLDDVKAVAASLQNSVNQFVAEVARLHTVIERQRMDQTEVVEHLLLAILRKEKS